MVLKLTTALLSSLLFCLSLAWRSYVPLSAQDQNSFYSSFLDLLLMFLIYATPVYVVGGVPSSRLIEMLQKKIAVKNRALLYGFNFVLYLFAGLIVTFLFLLVIAIAQGKIFADFSEQYFFFVLGAIASVLYYHVLLAATFIQGRLRARIAGR